MCTFTGYRNSLTSTFSNHDTDDSLMLYVCSIKAMGEANTDSSCWNPSLVDKVFLFWPCNVAYIPPQRSSSPWSTQQSSSFNISSSPGWVSVMTEFTQNWIDNEEEFELIHILLKAEWSELKNCIEFDWLSYLAMQGKSKKFMRGAQQTEKDKWGGQSKMIYIMKGCTEDFWLC